MMWERTAVARFDSRQERNSRPPLLGRDNRRKSFLRNQIKNPAPTEGCGRQDHGSWEQSLVFTQPDLVRESRLAFSPFQSDRPCSPSWRPVGRPWIDWRARAGGGAGRFARLAARAGPGSARRARSRRRVPRPVRPRRSRGTLGAGRHVGSRAGHERASRASA